MRIPTRKEQLPILFPSNAVDVTIVFFDSSAFVKLLVDEEGTELAVALWDHCDAAVSSRLAYPEVGAALGAARRAGRLDARQLRGVEREWEIYWAATRVVAMTDAVARSAAQLCRSHALRAGDGVHLASALALGSAEAADLVFASWDKRLADGASDAGLRVAPA